MKALIVSHQKHVISQLSARLVLKQVDVILASNNVSAIRLIKEKKPWLVFADAEGEIDAIDILRAIEDTCPETSVLGLTESFNPEQAISLFRRGVRDCLCLPEAILPASSLVEASLSEPNVSEANVSEANVSEVNVSEVKASKSTKVKPAQVSSETSALIDKAIYRAQERAKSMVDYMSEHDSFEKERDDVSHQLKQLQEDQEAGRYVQLKLLPQSPILLSGMEFSHRIFPSLYLSGDFIDYFPLNNNMSFFYFADVSGHGSSSAFVTVLLKTISHRWVNALKADLALEGLSPSAYIAFVNSELLNMQLGKHMTLFCGMIDHAQQTLSYSLAAHFPKPYYYNNGHMHVIEETALPVGIFEEIDYPEGQINLSDDFVLYLFSDGILELIKADSIEAKEANLFHYLQESKGDLEGVCEHFQVNSTQELPDDISMLMLRSSQ